MHKKELSSEEFLAKWIVRVLENPDYEEPNLEDPELYKAWKRIPELGERVLCVVYNETIEPWRIVTAYFDRIPLDRR